ncbi:DNA-processing protein DprA [Phreatobacter stygius]|uniref:DNA-protecting protein DprA n=1 Tax=Phreatobacter stygius TaxID=1940610 RepID=A0A4D7BD32_9HYPH|nr:DNA-processing protein DprA [Phreatobacter stygius]QCI68585.1 DNA-protecting protein DprA [Phreatobacter stygius]
MTDRPLRALDDVERLDWLRLARSDNVGPRTFRDLIGLYGGASAALDALPGLTRRGGGRDIRIATRQEAERETAAAARHGVRLVALCEPGYPELLREIAAPPPIIGIGGRAECLGRPMVGLVGSRNASVPGLKMAGLLARGLGLSGFTTVSGLARGIDTAVHQASLASGTVAVLAGGHDRIYPPENQPLVARILETGCVISEMPMGHEPRAKDFPRRNRLIAGLALGVVVVEAAERSGSLITARLALEENREVFAVPGSPLDPRAAGTNRLLKDGAVLVTELDDVESVLRPLLARHGRPLSAEEQDHPMPQAEPGDDERGRVLALLGPVPVTVDDLIRLSGLGVAAVRIIVLELELAGRLIRDSGGRISLA